MKHLGKNKHYTEHGFAHVGLVFVALLAIIGLLGYVGYNAWQKKLAEAGDTSTVGRHYFTKNDNKRLDGVKVFQNAAPPRTDDLADQSAYWPATDFATANTKGVHESTWSGGRSWYFQWANRRNYGEESWNRKPNPLPSPAIRMGKDSAGGDIECRLTYTSISRANAATRAQIRYVLGMSRNQSMKPWLDVPGTSTKDFVTEEALRANPTAYCKKPFSWSGWQGDTNYMVMTDKVLLPGLRMTKAYKKAGILLDYEVQDSRSPATTEAFIRSVADDVHSKGKKLFLYSNPLNAPTQKHTNLTEKNLPRILDAVDYLGVALWSGNREGSIPASYDNQVRMLGKMQKGEYKKLVLVFELGSPGTTLDDARWVYSKLHDKDERHPSTIMFWRNGAVQGEAGSTLTNQKMALALFNKLR